MYDARGFLLLAAASAALVACVPQSPVEIRVRDHCLPRDNLNILDTGGYAGSVLPEIPAYALMAASLYVPGRLSGRYCNSTVEEFHRWHRISEYSSEELDIKPPFPKFKVPGLDFAVFQNLSETKQYAIVFRGTVWTKWGDWYSNARWLTRFFPFSWDYYQQTRVITQELVARIRADSPGEDLEILAIGHSLGGGLAQQAAYSSADIKRVFAFNTSPVTGFTSIDHRVPARSKEGVAIFRIYESGEVLAGLRWAIRNVLPLGDGDPRITELRFNFRSSRRSGETGVGLVGQHAIAQFACDLICHIEQRQPHEICQRSMLP